MSYFCYYEDKRGIKETRQRILEEERKQREKKREVQRKYKIFQHAVDRCIAEGRDFTPLSIIWHEHWLDGFEGDVVFPAVEELPFVDDNELSDDDVSDDDSSIILVDEVPEIKEAPVDAVVERVVESEEIKGDPHDLPVEAIDINLQVHDSYVGEIEEEANSADLSEMLKAIQSTHTYVDPFLVDCRPLNFIIADLLTLKITIYERTITALFTSLLYRVVIPYMDLFKYVRPRLIFDPGRFEDESFTNGRE